MINAKRIKGGWNVASVLQAEGHEAYWFDNGWYHSDDCKQCAAQQGVQRTANAVSQQTSFITDSDLPSKARGATRRR